MNYSNDLIYEAVSNLEKLSNLTIDIESSESNYDAIVRIKNTLFIVESKSAMRTSNQGLVLSQLESIRKDAKKPLIFVAEYISKSAADQLRKNGFNYIDVAGNASIHTDDLAILIEGQTRKVKRRTNQSRAFQEAGLKIIFHLLRSPVNIKHSYRKIANEVDVSLGSVSNVMAELENLNFVLKTKDRRVIKNKSKLLERWVVDYNANLKPRILRSTMKFVQANGEKNWQDMDLSIFQGELLWGGEPAAAVLTGKLRPDKFTLYSNLELPGIARALSLVPDSAGNIEVLQKFWHDEKENNTIVPALLIYADLINSGLSRNIEIANYILKNELQHIQ